MRSHSCAIAVLTMLRFCGRKERLLGFTQLSLQVSFTSYLNCFTEISILIPNCVGDLTAGVQVEMLALRISSECHSSTYCPREYRLDLRPRRLAQKREGCHFTVFFIAMCLFKGCCFDFCFSSYYLLNLLAALPFLFRMLKINTDLVFQVSFFGGGSYSYSVTQ